MRNRILNLFALCVTALATNMAVLSLSEVSSASWYQPEIDPELIQKKVQ